MIVYIIGELHKLHRNGDGKFLCPITGCGRQFVLVSGIKKHCGDTHYPRGANATASVGGVQPIQFPVIASNKKQISAAGITPAKAIAPTPSVPDISQKPSPEGDKSKQNFVAIL